MFSGSRNELVSLHRLQSAFNNRLVYDKKNTLAKTDGKQQEFFFFCLLSSFPQIYLQHNRNALNKSLSQVLCKGVSWCQARVLKRMRLLFLIQAKWKAKPVWIEKSVVRFIVCHRRLRSEAFFSGCAIKENRRCEHNVALYKIKRSLSSKCPHLSLHTSVCSASFDPGIWGLLEMETSTHGFYFLNTHSVLPGAVIQL